MFKRRKIRLNGEWSLLAGNRVYELRLENIGTIKRLFLETFPQNRFQNLSALDISTEFQPIFL